MNDVPPSSTILELPTGGWLNRHIEPALAYGLGGLDKEMVGRLAVRIYNCPPGYTTVRPGALPWGTCHLGTCRVDALATHPVQVMEPLLAGFYHGPNSGRPMVDGLSPQVIADLLAHAVIHGGRSSFDAFQWQHTLPGYPDSFGAVLVEIPYRDAGGVCRSFKFIVSVAGGDEIDSDFIARTVGDRIRRGLLEDGVVPLTKRAGETLIVGLSSR